MNYPIAKHKRAINGVEGRAFAVRAPQDVRGNMVHRGQRWVSEARDIKCGGQDARMSVTIKFDDEFKNSHQSFTVTADIQTVTGRDVGGGMLHDEIENVFPELAPLIKWHRMTTDGPLYYIANTTYLASDRDTYGRAHGEPCQWEEVVCFADSPAPHTVKPSFVKFIKSRMIEDEEGWVSINPEHGEFRVVSIAHNNEPRGFQYQPKHTFVGYGIKWHECPFDSLEVAQVWAKLFNAGDFTFGRIATGFSAGKNRELQAARRAAIWPEATNDQLCLPKDELTALLEARLPALVAAFRVDMEAIGFLWEPGK